jgi:hypothetical protein
LPSALVRSGALPRLAPQASPRPGRVKVPAPALGQGEAQRQAPG